MVGGGVPRTAAQATNCSAPQYQPSTVRYHGMVPVARYRSSVISMLVRYWGGGLQAFGNNKVWSESQAKSSVSCHGVRKANARPSVADGHYYTLPASTRVL